MTDVARISPQEAKEKVSSGEALLVCAYSKEEKFEQFHLEGALSLAEFQNSSDKLPRDQEIIFYCN